MATEQVWNACMQSLNVPLSHKYFHVLCLVLKSMLGHVLQSPLIMCDSWVYDEVNQNDFWIHGDSEHGSAHRSSLSDGCQSTFLMHKDHTYPCVSSVVSKFTSDCMALKSQCTSMKTDHELWWEVRKRQAEKEGESKREAEIKYLDTVGVAGEIRCHTVFWVEPQQCICQATERLGYVCNPRSLKEGTETSRRVTDKLGSRLERPIHFECN